MIWDRLAVLTDEVSIQLEEALDWIKDAGVNYVDLRVIDGKNVADLTDDEALDVRRNIESRGLKLSSIASPVFKCALDPARPVASGDTFGQKEESVDTHFAKLNRVFQIAKLLGTSRIRIFSFWREADPAPYMEEVVRHLRRAAQEAEKEGMELLLENEPSCNGGFAEEIAFLIRHVDSPALRALWDPGNEAYGGREAYPAGYGQVRDILGYVHLKDAYIQADGSGRCVPIGSGNVPMIAQLKALQEDGYDGLFSIETHFIPAGGSRKTGTRMTLEALRALLTEV